MNGRGCITGTGLLKRILLALALACGFLLFLAAVNAYATPIRPDIRKIVQQSRQDATAETMPARAGWDGPEMRVQTAAAALQSVAGRAQRAELLAAAMPDPRAILAIAAMIFLLRLLKQQEEKRTKQAPVSSVPFPASPVPNTAANAGEERRAA